MVGTILLLILLAHRFIEGTFDYEEVTRLRMVIIPLYSLVMMVLTVHQHYTTEKLELAAALFLVGVVIGIFQASKVQIKDDHKVDAYSRPVIAVKRDWPYLIGWIIIFIICIGVEISETPALGHEEILHELLTEIFKDLSFVSFFFSKTSWFTWVLNVASSFAYEICLFTRYPVVRQAVGRKKH